MRKVPRFFVCSNCGKRCERCFGVVHICAVPKREQPPQKDFGGTKRTPDLWVSVRTFGARGHSSDSGRGH